MLFYFHELTPFLRFAQDFPSLLAQRGGNAQFYESGAPSLRSREGVGGEFMLLFLRSLIIRAKYPELGTSVYLMGDLFLFFAGERVYILFCQNAAGSEERILCYNGSINSYWCRFAIASCR